MNVWRKALTLNSNRCCCSKSSFHSPPWPCRYSCSSATQPRPRSRSFAAGHMPRHPSEPPCLTRVHANTVQMCNIGCSRIAIPQALLLEAIMGIMSIAPGLGQTIVSSQTWRRSASTCTSPARQLHVANLSQRELTFHTQARPKVLLEPCPMAIRYHLAASFLSMSKWLPRQCGQKLTYPS